MKLFLIILLAVILPGGSLILAERLMRRRAQTANAKAHASDNFEQVGLD